MDSKISTALIRQKVRPQFGRAQVTVSQFRYLTPFPLPEQFVSDGVVANYVELTRIGCVSRARLTQIMNLLRLAPDIQEEIFFLPPAEPGQAVLTEKQIRRVAAETDWREQRRMWRSMKGNWPQSVS